MRGKFGFDKGNHKGARNTQMKQKVFIYDTTLRDGTQGEGISLTVASKLRLAQKMDDFGVDFIEGG